MASSQGSQAKLCMDAVAPIDTSSEPYEFLSISGGAEHQIIRTEGIRGTRSRSKERRRRGLQVVQFSIVMNPSPAELDKLLPRILGANESTDVFALAETLPTFLVCVDRIAKVHTYTGCVVSRATFRSSTGQPLQLTLDIIGVSETEGDAGSFPSLSLDTDTMFVHSDAVLTVQSSARSFDQAELIIDNRVVSRFMNSRTATDVAATDREILFNCSTPYTSSESDLITTPAGSSAGAAATLAYTNGNQSISFALANLIQDPARTPGIPGRGEILLPLNFRAEKSGSTNELIVTHDSST